MNITTCPQPEELQQLIEGSLSGERQVECTQHMDSCQCCQEKLEVLATGGSNFSQVVVHAYEVEPVASSAYWPALKELDADLSETYVPRSTPRSAEVSLQFLQPPTDPAYLGRLAHFDVMRVLGRGGMGVVLEAFDSKLQRHVALKVLDPDLAYDELSRQRFCREARSAASITHENVVAVYQVEKAAGDHNLPYLVMQLISGESLEQRLTREKKLPMREIVRIAMEASHGLVAAHAQGLIHRDIKPGNILLEGPENRVKLTDFGLARVVDDPRLTRTGFVTGTPLYMAPEQARGDQEVDYRSDLFSFGAILYEMCAGEPPFAGNSALAILRQIADVKHRPLREVNPEIPEWLAHTIDTLLEKKPEDRIQSASHLAELLDYEWALMRTTSEDVPVVCQIAIQKRAKRNRRIAAGVGAAFLAVGLLAGSFLAGGRRDGKTEVSSAKPVATLSANSGAVWSVAFAADGKSIAMGVEDGSVRIWDIASQSVTATLSAHRANIWSMRYSPDGTMLATAGDDGFIKLWQLPETEPIESFESTNSVRGVAFAKDSHTLFTCGKEGGVRCWKMGFKKAAIEKTQHGAVLAIALSPDNETVATAGSDKIVRLWNANTLSTKLLLEGHTGPIYGLAYSPDGTRLASSGWDKSVRIWNTASGQPVQTWTAHSGDVWSVAYSPDGTKLATGGSEGAVKIWDVTTGKLISTFLGHENAVHTVAFNRDGTDVASGGRDGAVRIWAIK
jgi:WD40 repeat protein